MEPHAKTPSVGTRVAALLDSQAYTVKKVRILLVSSKYIQY